MTSQKNLPSIFINEQHERRHAAWCSAALLKIFRHAAMLKGFTSPQICSHHGDGRTHHLFIISSVCRRHASHLKHLAVRVSSSTSLSPSSSTSCRPHRRTPSWRQRRCGGSAGHNRTHHTHTHTRSSSGQCKVTEAACIYRRSEWRNVLLTLELFIEPFTDASM